MAALLTTVTAAILLTSSCPALCKMCYFVEGKCDFCSRLRDASMVLCQFVGGSLLTAPSIERCTNCSQLNTSNNNISGLYDESLEKHPNLVTLWAYNNKIYRVTPGAFSTLHKLFAVYLSNNRLSDIPVDTFKNNLNLKYLSLDSNNLILPQKGPFLNAPSVKYLNMSFCNLTSIPAQTFIGTKNVTHLCLDGNKIKELSRDSLSPLSRLKFLNISMNMIQRLKFVANLPIIYLSALELPLETIASEEYLSALSNLTLSQNVCCCKEERTCEGSELSLPGREWLARCVQCQQTSPWKDNSTRQTSAKSIAVNVTRLYSRKSTTTTLSVEISEISREVTTPLSVSKEMIKNGRTENAFPREETIIVETSSGDLLTVTILLAVLVVVLVVAMGIYLVRARWRRSERGELPPGERQPYEYLPPGYSICAMQHLPCRHSCVSFQNKVTTDLDADDNYTQTPNHLYETVDETG